MNPGPDICEFGDFRIDLRRRLLLSRHDGQPITLTGRVFDTLAFFIERPGQLLCRGALLDGIWPDAEVEDNNLSQNISTLRRVLGEKPGEHEYIATVPGRGYRFIAQVVPQLLPSAPPVRHRESRSSGDPETDRLYAQALRLMERPAPDTLQLCIESLQAALARDPGHAPAWCWLADARIMRVRVGLGSLEDLVAAEHDAMRALALDADCAMAHAVLGNIHVHRGDWLQAEACYLKAIECDPADPMPQVMQASMVLQSVGHGERARQLLHAAFALAPADPRMMLNLAMSHAIAGDDAAALHFGDLAMKFGFPAGTAPLPLTFALAAQRGGQYDTAAAHYAVLLPPPLREARVAERVCAGLAAPQARLSAVAALDDACAAHFDGILRTGNLTLLFLGWYAQLGVQSVAYQLAGKAIEHCMQHHWLPPNWQTLWIPELADWRQSPRFEALSDRLGFRAYWARHGKPQDCA